MLPPQSDDEIRPYVLELQQIDRLLDIRWNPKARVIVPGSYSVMGVRVDPVYAGRWEVIRYDSPEQGHAGFHPERGYTVITEVCTYGELDGIRYIVRDGDFEPIDSRIVTFMRSADAWNTEQRRHIREKLWAQHDALEEATHALDEAKAREGLDHNHFVANFAGGVGNWQGKGADFKAMEADAKRSAVKRILSAK